MQSDRQTFSDDDMALDLGGLLRLLARAMGWLLPLTLFVAAAVFVGLQFVAPKYKAEARILIESTDSNFPGGSRGVEEERAVLDSEGVASQVQLLMSADLARRVAQKLDLAAVPEFEAQGSNSPVSRLLRLVGLGSDDGGNTEEERVLKHYFENLDIYRLEGSRVIAVDYKAQNPVLSAKIANTIVEQYLAVQSNAKRESTEQTSAALQPQIAELRKEVQAARQAVADFRSRADLLIGSDNIPLNQQQLAETSSDYSAAQATKAEAQAKADLIRELLKSGASLETASDVLNSALIQRLRERQVEIQSNIAELSITLLPNHPQLKALQSQLGDYDRQIRNEARRILQGLENDSKVANQQALALEKRLGELKTAAARTNADQARLSELEREANAKAAQLDQLMLSYQEADSRLRAQVLPADARVISQASVPAEPFSPKIISSTIIAALVTLILGSALVIMRAFLSGEALYRINERDAARGASDDGNLAQRSAGAPYVQSDSSPVYGQAGSYQWSGGYGQSYAAYASPAAYAGPVQLPRSDNDGNETEAREEDDVIAPLGYSPGLEDDRHDSAGERRDAASYDRDFAPDWVRGGEDDAEDDLEEFDAFEEDDRALHDAYDDDDAGHDDLPEDAEAPTETDGIAAASVRTGSFGKGPGLSVTTADDVAAIGRIVVLSVDDDALSHDLAFDLARKAAKAGKSALMMEVFPELADEMAAEGFSDIVAGKAPFAKVVYRDAASKAHIIEAGRLAITDEMVGSERFKLALDAIKTTYETVVVDLGAIDGSLASARLLSFADRVLIAASSPDSSHELHSAANLLSYNTGAKVDVVIAGAEGPDPRRNDDGHAA
ncbi:succinoglycan transporter [Rhodobacterales bacterium]|nr:succinoglycan transporter [Rhodobacterales bacterium]